MYSPKVFRFSMDINSCCSGDSGVSIWLMILIDPAVQKIVVSVYRVLSIVLSGECMVVVKGRWMQGR